LIVKVKKISTLNMKRIYVLLFALLSACSMPPGKQASVQPLPQTLTIASVDSFVVNSSIRALEVADQQQIWFAGSGGVYGYTENGGASWTVDSILHDSIRPHFRGIAVTPDAVFLLGIGSPALLFRSTNKGKDWALVYEETHPDAFYDAITFSGTQRGIAIGDPTDGCLSVIRTEDGGQHWEKVDCEHLPEAGDGEAAFAASNTNVVAIGDEVWMASGGKQANVYYSNNFGKNWTSYPTPILQGQQMTGIFSMAFYDRQNGFIMGGDWEQKQLNTGNKAATQDGGKSWSLVSEGSGPGYRSCVQYLPGADAKGLMACGIPGISYSNDGGHHWQSLSDRAFYTLRFGPDWKCMWVAGNGVVAKVNWKVE
jgi:photosystem II stability/assembly factor-like uncharacterized protein